MTALKHVIVVGGGIIGASIAWHLARSGARVTVIAEQAGGVATPNSFAWINASWGNPQPYFNLRTRSMVEWTRLAREVSGLPLSWSGGLCWDLPPAEMEAYAEQHGRWGYGIRRVDPATIADIEPNLAAPPEFALHIAAEGAAEPTATAHLLLADAARHGATLLMETTVHAVMHTDGRVTGVETSAGPMTTDHVVLAAGVGTAALGASLGVRIPMDAPAGLIVHSHPHETLLNGLVIAPELHVRQTAEGRIIAGSDFGGSAPGDDPAVTAAALFSKVKSFLKGGEALTLDFHTVGYRPTPADGFPVVGNAAGIDGLYIAVMHSGVTLAPAIGLFAAREILTGDRDALLAPYGLERFD